MFRLDVKTGRIAPLDEAAGEGTLVDLTGESAPAEVPAEGPLVLRLPAAAEDADFAPLLARAVAVEILPRHARDGSPASLARHLRRHFGYRGTIRIRGRLVPQMADLMRRVGVDALDLPEEPLAEAHARCLAIPKLWFQFARDARPTVPELRHGRSRKGVPA
ncbi:MAG: hypothetical protein KatS3mg119_0513 [Rhodothalassiaceae bacterium]|nr:MAG: hypothetical protein KatS3mg119_0513 [Rhodothalassiaceae bacterium]